MFDPAKYPADWEAIAARVKDAAGWRCQSCAVACTSLAMFNELHDRACGDRDCRSGEVCGFADDTPVLTVHHIDRDRMNSAAENLIALCPGCHLAAERDAIARERATRNGRLPGFGDAAIDTAEVRRRILAGRFAPSGVTRA